MGSGRRWCRHQGRSEHGNEATFGGYYQEPSSSIAPVRVEAVTVKVPHVRSYTAPMAD